MSIKTTSKEGEQILSSIAAFLREYRLQCGLTQEELSERSGLHANTISHLESGKPHNIMTLVEICIALDLPLREVFWEL